MDTGHSVVGTAVFLFTFSFGDSGALHIIVDNFKKKSIIVDMMAVIFLSVRQYMFICSLCQMILGTLITNSLVALPYNGRTKWQMVFFKYSVAMNSFTCEYFATLHK